MEWEIKNVFIYNIFPLKVIWQLFLFIIFCSWFDSVFDILSELLQYDDVKIIIRKRDSPDFPNNIIFMLPILCHCPVDTPTSEG